MCVQVSRERCGLFAFWPEGISGDHGFAQGRGWYCARACGVGVKSVFGFEEQSVGANECAVASREKCMHLRLDVIRRSFSRYQRPLRWPARRMPCSLPLCRCFPSTFPSSGASLPSGFIPARIWSDAVSPRFFSGRLSIVFEAARLFRIEN